VVEHVTFNHGAVGSIPTRPTSLGKIVGVQPGPRHLDQLRQSVEHQVAFARRGAYGKADRTAIGRPFICFDQEASDGMSAKSDVPARRVG
jgi:hypothetical protein